MSYSINELKFHMLFTSKSFLYSKFNVYHPDDFLSPYLCCYRKGFNTQYTKKWKKTLYNKDYTGAVLIILEQC